MLLGLEIRNSQFFDTHLIVEAKIIIRVSGLANSSFNHYPYPILFQILIEVDYKNWELVHGLP
jgi:hypothetical protein